MWKVFKLSDGNLIKAGFDSEDSARDWLESHERFDPEDYDCTEMAEEEEETFLEAQESEEVEELDADDFERGVEGTMDYDTYDDDYDGDDGLLNEFEPDDD